jgi:hypothetical protein
VRISTRPEINAARGFEDISTRKSDWYIHDRADVAAILSPADPKRHKMQKLPVDTFINRNYRFDVSRFAGRGREAMERMMIENFPNGIEVEVGHDLYFPGLFVQSAGKNTILPIVRFGNIARMPSDEELLTLENPIRKMQIRGYLAESHSWGGHSGSPVFWFYTYNINIPIEVKEWRRPESRFSINASPPARTRPANVMIGNGWAQGLLGLVSGHYDILTKAKNKAQTLEDIQLGINAGIAIVTPADNIREILMRPDVVDDRKERAETIEETAAVADFSNLSTRRKRKMKRKNRDILVPAIKPISFFDDPKKGTRRRKP